MHYPADLKLFLLPGLDGTGLLFNSLLKELPTELNTEVISYPPNKLQTFDQHVNYVISRLPKTEPFVLLAESFSGPIAIEILKSGNFAIKKTFFITTFARSPRPILLGLAKYLPLTCVLKLNIPKILIRRYCLGKNATGEQIETFKDTIRQVEPEVIARRLAIIADIDRCAALKYIKTPCCYLQATDDKLVPVDAIDVFNNFITNLKTKTVNGPHFILQAEPKLCAEVICEEIAM